VAARTGNFLSGRFHLGEGELWGVRGVFSGKGAITSLSLLAFVSQGGETCRGTVEAVMWMGMVDGGREWWGEGMPRGVGAICGCDGFMASSPHLLSPWVGRYVEKPQVQPYEGIGPTVAGYSGRVWVTCAMELGHTGVSLPVSSWLVGGTWSCPKPVGMVPERIA